MFVFLDPIEKYEYIQNLENKYVKNINIYTFKRNKNIGMALYNRELYDLSALYFEESMFFYVGRKCFVFQQIHILMKLNLKQTLLKKQYLL